jgi:ketosteroid isomerase-like protein
MSEENVEVVRRVYPDSSLDLVKAWADEDVMVRYEALLLPFVHPNAEVIADSNFAVLGDTGRAAPSGIEAFREIWRDWLSAWGSFRVHLEDLVSLPDSRVLALVESHGRPKTGGVEMSLRSGAIWTLTDGQVSRLEHFLDRDQALEAAGLSE